MDSEKIKFLIADTTAFINNVNLHEYAENILTVPDVIQEVKNKRQLRRLVVLPFDLIVREPSSENLKHVTNFAKKTGDYMSLSAIDMKVIALTYELHKEHIGADHLRGEPVVSQIIVSKEKPAEFIDNKKLAGFHVPKAATNDEGNLENKSDSDFQEGSQSATREEVAFDESEENLEHDDVKSNSEGENDEIIDRNKFEEEEQNPKNSNSDENHVETENDNLCESMLLKMQDVSLDDKIDSILVAIKNSDESQSEEDLSAEDSDDESDWITPSNIKNVKKEIEGNLDDEVPKVACMTTDYALQNVLKQINLNVCALNGRVIKHLRTYILRCYGCFKTTSIMTKIFCPKCGNKTLKRVAVSLDENGKQVIHINTKRPLTAKYKNQSLPRPRGGKHSRNPLVVEDQPMPKQMPSRVAKTKTQALDEDYIAGYSPFATRDLSSKSALLRAKGHIKEWARNNSFEEERRKKYFNRLVK
ncbi:RNA-binding protein NOB1 [Condylostylus longicornis]|uniref:RNA-binding protein NOB1 n=1 Tax=Condylostylus longicornis TaxID=2530218 RepID=UPI00244E3B21|nr:RNA-binding protein NOB1 [Condylostylus longicornis]